MTQPINYATPVERAATPMIAWLSIALAGLAFLVDVFAVYFVRSQSMAYVNTGNAAGLVLVSSPPPMWVHLLQVLAIGLPLVGLVLAIVALRRRNTNKAVAIIGMVLNALMLGALLLIA